MADDDGGGGGDDFGEEEPFEDNYEVPFRAPLPAAAGLRGPIGRKGARLGLSI